MSQKVSLVTGGAGFIGSHMVEALLARGHEVVVVDNFSTGKKENLPEDENLYVHVGDVNRHEDLQFVFEKYRFDWVFHYAAVVGVDRTLENPLSVLHDIDGMKNLLQLCIRYGAGKVAFSSSSEVYGECSGRPFTEEESSINVHTPYTIVKVMSEYLMNNYFRKYGLKTTVFRIFNVYGPRQDASPYGFVVSIFTDRAIRGEEIPIYGDGNAVRDFTYVDDNINASIALMESDESNGRTFNICTGQPITIMELARTIKDLTHSDSEIRLHPKRDDILYRIGDPTRLQHTIDCPFHHSLKTGLRKTLQYYRQRNGFSTRIHAMAD